VAVVLILLLAIGTVGYFGYLSTHQTTVFTLSPSTVVAGDTVLVTAKHLPANQTGEIRLHSDLVRFPFRADRSGAVSGEILIPFDSGAGDHLVELCWASRCHISAILHVLDSGAVTSPTPGESPSTTPGATPGATPAPGSSPSPRAGSTPTPRATPLPAASPTPTATATPTPSPQPRSISLSSTHFTILNGGATTVSGSNFSAGRTVTITFVQSGTTKAQTTVVVASTGSFSQFLNVPGPLLAGSATISACDTSCASQTVQVTAI
jgi:hypothetical protein